MNQEATFGIWMRQRRRMLDLTQSDLAQKVGCSEITIRKVESGERSPSRQISELIATALDVPEHEREAFIACARGIARPAQTATPIAPVSATPLTTHLPVPLTRLLGRDRELEQICAQLTQPHICLLSLVGPPGIGKTRLSLQVAAKLQSNFPDHVAFIPFAPVRAPELIVPTLIQALGIVERADQTPLTSVVQALAERDMLLIFDNLEHLLTPTSKALIADLLRMAPRLKLLLTSRSALHISGEQLFLLQPLEVAHDHSLSPESMLAASPAMQLFLERVQAFQPTFRIDHDNAHQIAEICARLDGLPLAIELAAARSRLFAPAALLARLQTSTLQLLVDGPHDLLAHQRTLRSTLDWSYTLLSPAEGELFVRLAAFAGGCSLEAAEAICAEGEACILDALLALERQSLIRLELDQRGATRVVLLETMREYALSRFETAPDYRKLQHRHAHYYANQALSLSQAPTDDQLAALQADLHNLRLALECSIEHDTPFAMAWAVKLTPFWMATGLLSEGRSYLQRLLALDRGRAEPLVRADLLITLGYLAHHQGDCEQATNTSEEGLVICRQADHELGCADALLNLARVALQYSHFDQAETLASESLALYRRNGELRGAADALRCLTLVAKDQCHYDRAAHLGNASAALYRQSGDQRGFAKAIYNLATIAYWQEDFARSGELATLAIQHARQLGDQIGLAYALEGFGMVSFKQGKLGEARQLLREALELFQSLNERIGIALLLQELGHIANASADYAEALELLSEALELAWQINEPRRAAFCLECLADTVSRIRPQEAAALLGAARRLRQHYGTPLPQSEQAEYERIEAYIRRQSGDPSHFESAWQTGYEAVSEQFIEQTLSRLPMLSTELFFASDSLLEKALEFGALSKKDLLLSY
jgi:predicted ATPase/transcriptional regulator with XRE-family HTH domain